MTVAGAQDLTSVLSVENLSIALPEGGDRPFAVEQVSFAIKRNEVVCLVGESRMRSSRCCRRASTSCRAP
jgi:ABC-type dipeptide/oligopeptide/nickel transport system ATPase component